MSTLLGQFGVVDEVAYGTPLTVTRFFETEDLPDFRLDQGRSEAATLRSGGRVMRADRFIPFRKGAAGSVSMPVPTKGFGFWLKHMLGTVATGTVTDLNYPHTATIGTLLGKSFTAQVGRPFSPYTSVQPFTYEGGKVAKWELSLDVDGLLMVNLDCDFEDENTSTGLATFAPTAAATVFSFVSATVTIGAVAIELKNFKVAMDNGLDTDRRFIRGNPLKKEPVEAAMRTITWEAEADFSDLVQYNRYRDALASNTVAAIVATFSGPFAHAGATLPSLVLTLAAARFDKDDIGASGAEPMTQAMSGVGLDSGTGSPLTIVYTTTDVTP